MASFYIVCTVVRQVVTSKLVREDFPPHFIIIFDSLNFPYMHIAGQKETFLKSFNHYLNMCTKLGTSTILFLFYLFFK